VKVLLVVADALRADHLGCYGYGRPTTPILDAVAKRGARFERFFAPSIPTEPAHTSIFSGEHAARHGVMVHKESRTRPRAGMAWLPALLKNAGVKTVAFDNLGDSKAWFAQGWSECYNLRHAKSLLTAADINRELIPWLDRHTDGSWFCFVHYWDPHSPYLAPVEYRRRYYEGEPDDGHIDDVARWQAQPSFPFAYRWQVRHYEPFRDLDYVRALYDAEINYLDEELARVFDALSALGDECIVIFTSDHGEVMDDRPGFFDHAGLYEDTIRVPLIVSGSGVPEGVVIEGMYQHLDLAPTILSLFGQSVPASMSGRNLVHVAANHPADPGYQTIILSEGTWEIKWGIRTQNWKFVKVIDAGVHGVTHDELYHLSSDPRERVNLAGLEPETMDLLELSLRREWEVMLAGSVDRLKEQAERGVPARAWLEEALKEGALG
jgi:arylsulfatase